MTRTFEPAPRNALAERMAALDAQEAAKRVRALDAICDEMWHARLCWTSGASLEKDMQERMKALHEQIGKWLEGDYE